MYLGIDLGTSNSAVVGHVDGETRLFKTSDGADVLPSVIYLDKRGHRFVGKAAQDRLVSAPANVAAGFKRLMGTKSPIRLGDTEWSPETCSAEIIKTLVSQATTESGVSDIDGTVITIPAAFNQMQSEATIEAARIAGLDRVSLLQEPVAAAMASVAHSKQKDGVFLIYDLGGGTFDVALVLSAAGEVNVIAHEGVNMLGGRDFDRIIFDALVRPWLSDNFNLPMNFQKEPDYRHLSDVARHAVERAKIQLSASTSASIFASEDEVRATDLDGEEIYISLDLTRGQLEELVRERLEDSIQLCRKIIEDNGYRHEDISHIVPIGGPSKMPIIREMLQTELAIDVAQGLDPMTAVARGAAIFAESREWDGEKSTRKAAVGHETISGQISLSLDYKSRVSGDTARIRIKPAADVPDGFEVEILDEEGGTTGRKPIDGPVALSVRVRKNGENKFRVAIFDPSGRMVEEASRDISIVRSEASTSSIPMTYTLAVKIQTGMVGYERNVLEPLLEKGTPLPAEGKKTFRAGKTLKGGEQDHIAFQFYEMAKGVENPEHNLRIGDFLLDARNDLERGERINRGDDIIVHWQMSDNGTLKFSVELPQLGRFIEAHNLYFAEIAQENFEGQNGAELAGSLLAKAQTELDTLDETLGGNADATGKMHDRIEQLHLALSTSTDADTHRSVASEARRLRQEIALLRLSPENEERVLMRDVAEAETEFDHLRDIAGPVDKDRHDKLLVTTRMSIRNHNYDDARRSLEEMRGIRFKVLSDSPEFLNAAFRHLADERYLALDEALHDQLVAQGIDAANAGDVPRLRQVIARMVANRVSGSGDADEILELAHLLGT